MSSDSSSHGNTGQSDSSRNDSSWRLARQNRIDTRDLNSDSPQAFAALVERYQQPIFSFLGRMGFSQATAEDIAQESFLKVWRYRKRYNPAKGRVFTWMFTITRNLALNEIQRAQRAPYELDTPDAITDPTQDPAITAENTQARRRLQQALTTLSASDRMTIALDFADALSARECAHLENCSEASFRTRVSRARQRLIKAYHNLEFNHDR